MLQKIFGPETADSIMSDLVAKISKLESSSQQFNSIAETKREQADDLLLEAADREREAARCDKFRAKLEEFFNE